MKLTKPTIVYLQQEPPLRLVAVPREEGFELKGESADLDLAGGLRWSRSSGAEFRFAVLRLATLALERHFDLPEACRSVPCYTETTAPGWARKALAEAARKESSPVRT